MSCACWTRFLIWVVLLRVGFGLNDEENDSTQKRQAALNLADLSQPDSVWDMGSRQVPSNEGEETARRSRRVVGGSYVGDRYPWAVRVVTRTDRFICTGSIISPRLVLTAGHCLLDQSYRYRVGTDFWVDYNCTDLNSADCLRAYSTELHTHPCYTPSSNQDHDDIAILRVDRDLPSPYAKVDGIGGITDKTTDTMITSIGYGSTVGPVGQWSASSTLQGVDLPVVSKQSCERANPDSLNLGMNYDNAFCVGGEAGKDSCAGDSGGAAVHDYHGESYVVGVLSVGSELPTNMDCAVQGRHGVYTLVRQYSAWIWDILQGNQVNITSCPHVQILNKGDFNSDSSSRRKICLQR